MAGIPVSARASKASWFFAFSAAVAALIPGPARAQMPGPAKPVFERGDSIEVRGVEIFDRIIYLPVSINGLDPLPFVLDTGDGQLTALDAQVALSMGLQSTIIGEGHGAGDEVVQFGLTDSTTISIAGISFPDRPLLTIPLKRMEPHWGRRKDGLVGGDLLSALVTRIDYEGGRLFFHDPASYEHGGSGEKIPVTVENNYIFVEAKVFLYGSEEPVDATFLVDTGVRISIFNGPFSRKHDLAAQSPGTLFGVTGYGLSGVSSGTVGRVRGIGIGSFFVDAPVVTFSADTVGVLSGDNFSGIIGADILSRFGVIFDYGRSLMVLEKNGSFGDPSEFDMCGIRFVMEGENFDLFKVFSIFKGSPADIAGIAAGDIVRAIDGREAGTYTKESLRDYLQRDGESVLFRVERGGEARDVKIRLKRMV